MTRASVVVGCIATMSLGLISCTGLLPKANQETLTPWHSYAEAQAMFAKIIPRQTTVDDLRVLGIDAEKSTNVALLSHADLLRRIIATSSIDIRLLDQGLQECIAADQRCYAYEIEQSRMDRKRYGNFWLDILGFHRKTDVSGWQFDAIIVFKDNMVIYKLWSGKPNIHQHEEERSPLGPFQGIGSSILTR